MPRYFLNLVTRTGIIRDPEGTELPDQSSAREHARAVAVELMRCRETKTRPWRLNVCDEAGQPCFDLLFAEIDVSLDHVAPELRTPVVKMAASFAGLAQAMVDIKTNILELRTSIARSSRTPPLVVGGDERID